MGDRSFGPAPYPGPGMGKIAVLVSCGACRATWPEYAYVQAHIDVDTRRCSRWDAMEGYCGGRLTIRSDYREPLTMSGGG